MTLENQVVSLELAKRLKELGVKQESVYRWTFWANPNGPSLWDEQSVRLIDLSVKETMNIWEKGIPAYTVAELGEMLPFEVNIPFKSGKKRANNHILSFRPCKNLSQGTHSVAYFHTSAREYLTENADTEADARAKMLIYLLENKLVTI